MRISATTLESFRLHTRGRVSEAELVASIKREWVPTHRVLRGRAFGEVLADPDAHRSADGAYRAGTFVFPAAMVEPALAVIPPGGRHEVTAIGEYGAHTVVARADYVVGRDVEEWKTRAGAYQPERYLASIQWRLLVDLFRPSSLTYRIFRLSPKREVLVTIETLPVGWYADVHADCQELVDRFARWAGQRGLAQYMPDRPADPLVRSVYVDRQAGVAAAPAPVVVKPGLDWASHPSTVQPVARPTRGASYLAALSTSLCAAMSRDDLEACKRALQLRSGGAGSEGVLVALNHALARTGPRRAPSASERPLPIAPTVLPPLAPVAEAPSPTFRLRAPRVAPPRQLDLLSEVR